jgi:ribosome-binding protein aMBF1 (putative translation factor)
MTWIKGEREARGWSRNELSHRSWVCIETLRRLEEGYSLATHKTYWKIRDAFRGYPVQETERRIYATAFGYSMALFAR